MVTLLVAATIAFVSQMVFVFSAIVTRQKMVNLVNPRLVPVR
jgi:hypothetical protein